jgi:hypothetical protein
VQHVDPSKLVYGALVIVDPQVDCDVARPAVTAVLPDHEERRRLLAAELRERLDRLGYEAKALPDAFETWAGTQNLEDRVDGLDRIDPVVLEELRKR